MEFAILGPLRARRDEHELPLGGPKQRALLAMLLLYANEVISRERLIEGMWGEQPPPTAEHTLDNYVSRLRRVLGDGRVERRSPGYSLRVEPGELDLERFERLVERGRIERGQDRSRDAATTLNEALALWRGAALADVLYEPFAAREAERLEELRIAALEERIEAEVALGRDSAVIPELERLVRTNPFRERPLSLLMLALYRSGRQTEALSLFQARRLRLSEELGLEPGPQLQELQRQILAHDERLDAPRVRHPMPRTGSRPHARRLAVAGAFAVIAAGAAVGLIVATGGGSARSADVTSSQIVGLRVGAVAARLRVEMPNAPAAIVATGDSLWSADPSTGAVSRVDLASGTVADRVPVGGTPGALAAGGGSVWVASVPGDHVTRIDPDTGAVTQTIPLGGARVSALAFGSGGLWVADLVDNSLMELLPGSGARRRTLRVHLRPTSLAIAGGRIWVAGYRDGEVEELDLESGQTVGTVHVGNGPASLAAGLGAIWVANSLDSTVSRIDPATDSVTDTIPVGSGPTDIAVAGGSVWVADQYSATVSRIDPGRNSVVRKAFVHGSPTAITAAKGQVFAAIRPIVKHRGGTLVLLHTRPISIDPALHGDLMPTVSDGLTGDALVAYNHVGGPAGIQLVPDLAVAVPVPTDNGRTYTFRLRPGIRYSNGRPLRAADFRRGVERLFRVGSYGRALFDGIVGAARCRPDSCDLSSGVVTSEAARTVTYHLIAGDPDFLDSLATHGLGFPMPAGTPFHDTGLVPIPGTGPYRIASASTHEMRYVRNRYFREWSHAAQPDGNPDEIHLRFGLTSARAVRQVEQGHADWSADNVPAQLLPRLQRKYASRLHSFSIPTTDFFQFNTTLPPFDDVRVRRALNFALDRGKIERLYGGSALATPTCQILPPGVVGYRRYCPYTRNPSSTGRWAAPDLARAHRLISASGTRGTPVTVWGWTDDPTLSLDVVRYTAGVLRSLGFPVRVQFVPHAGGPEFDLSTVQLIPAAWGDTPFGFFATWFACDGASDHGFFCDPRVDAAIKRAQALKATNPRAAANAWAELDRQMVDRALWVPMIDEHAIDFVSARVHSYEAHPYWGILADQLWIG